MFTKYILYWGTIVLFCAELLAAQTWKVDTEQEWQQSGQSLVQLETRSATDWGGIIDVMGNGALLLEKLETDSLYTRVSSFYTAGEWVSNWQDFGEEVSMQTLTTSILCYGAQLKIREGWTKFSGNPVISGGNILLPLNPDNITDQTILLPAPGGVPQDQAIVRGRDDWEGKWVLFFNHTPNAWPNEYYWSAVIADSLSPLKQGLNPFKLDTTFYPLFGPINNHAPNDWLEVDGTIYAPDETHDGDSHMWRSTNMLTWEDMGPISGINGSDPGMTYDGQDYYLFNESNNELNYNRLNADFTSVIEGDTVLNVGDHTGDADVAFFNNQWHMFFDDGPHLHYNIGYAFTTAEAFPYGWNLENDIYGPHIPEQGQVWDDDTEDGNLFGTGDADIALEGTSLYLFTERPVGAAYKELTELNNLEDVAVWAMVESDLNGDQVADDSSGWKRLAGGETSWTWKKSLRGRQYRVRFKLNSSNPAKSPLIQCFILSVDKSRPSKLKLDANPKSMLNFRDSVSNLIGGALNL